MMTAQQLKNSILQRAIEGKLVEQRAEEGTAKELLKEIKLEKEKLVKKGKIKKSKALPPITEDEIPFDIPDSWEWVRLDDLVIKDIKRGKSPTYTDNSKVLVFAQKCNTKVGKIDLELAKCLDESKLSKYPEAEFMISGDIVINSTGTGTMGRVGFFGSEDNKTGKPIVPDSHVTVVRTSKKVHDKYLYSVLKNSQQYLEKNGEGSTNQKELKAATIQNMLIPLQPPSEQHRIVDKIEELMPLVDQYDKAYSQLMVLNEKFPQDMKKSILQYAIEGKLVEQRPEEGTAKELLKEIKLEKEKLVKEGKIKKSKALASITEDEIPFDIPENWEWVRLGDIGLTNIGLTYKPTDIIHENGTAVLRSNNIQDGKIVYDDMVYVKTTVPSNKMCNTGDILICARNGSKRLVGKAAVIEHEGMSFGTFMAIFKPLSLDSYYVLSVINSAYFRNTLLNDTGTTTINQITQTMLKDFLIPLPPLSEQHRIVAKIEELMPLCDKLVKTK